MINHINIILMLFYIVLVITVLVILVDISYCSSYISHCVIAVLVTLVLIFDTCICTDIQMYNHYFNAHSLF